MVNISAVKARMGSIPDGFSFNRSALSTLVKKDLPELIEEIIALRMELEEFRASLTAKAETVKLNQGRGIHLP